jgi:ubiquinone/menaquinone biosynthesis C-methylase UbiE
MFHPEGPSFVELMQQAFSGTTEGYDLLAPKFDLTPFRTPDEILDVMASQVGEVQDGIDFCCGTGAGMKALRRVCSSSISGIDLSEGMLEVARSKVGEAPGDAQVKLIHGDALSHSFQGEYDLVTCFGAFGHILVRDEPQFVKQVKAALKPGGRFVFITTGAPDNTNWQVWAARGFNACMHIRNAVVDPPFHMYYLTFRLPRATQLLQAEGFTVEVQRGLFGEPFSRALLVTATRPA